LIVEKILCFRRPVSAYSHERGHQQEFEVLLQTGTYCGLPAAMDSFRIAREVFKERGL